MNMKHGDWMPAKKEEQLTSNRILKRTTQNLSTAQK